MLTDTTLPKLRWACRRGMLELDLLLLDFLEHCYSSLSAQQQQAFVQLLACEDQDLFNWLIKHETPHAPAFASITKIIICHATARV